MAHSMRCGGGAANKRAEVQRKPSDGRRDGTVAHGRDFRVDFANMVARQQPAPGEVLETPSRGGVPANKTLCPLPPT